MDRELWSELYRRMVRIRVFEDEAARCAAKGEIPGALHTAAGQEGEIVGACMALAREDYMVGNHRSHGHPIGKGAALGPLMAELYGKRTGVCRGKGGSMHLADFSVGSLGETSIVGSGLPVAVGAALEKEGLSVEVIDPRTLVPLDAETILASVRKTGRLVAVDPAHRTCSAASEIAAIVAERAFPALRAPVARVTTPDTHIPFSPALEARLFPSKQSIADAVRRVVAFDAGSARTSAGGR